MPARSRNPDIGALSLQGWALEAQAAAGIAKALAPTAFVPDHLRVWTNPQERDPAKRILDLDGTVAQVTAVLLAGQELEFGPMASLRAFVIIRGTVALYALAARALLQRHGHEVKVVESTSSRAVVHARRSGTDDWQEAIWDTDRATRAGLYPGHVDGNWRKQTKSMLVARATAEACRWVAADAMLGLPLLAEEVEDGDALEPAVWPEEHAGNGAAPSRPAPGGTRGRRTTAPRAALPAAPPMPVPEQQQPPERPSTEPPPDAPRPSKPQMARLHAGLRELQVTGPEEGLALISAWAGRRISNTGHLTRDEAGLVVTRINTLLAARTADRAEDQPPPDSVAEPPPGKPDGVDGQGVSPDAEPEH